MSLKRGVGFNMFLNESRREYTKYEFDKQRALDDPFQQFDDWFEFAKKNAVFEPNAMHLSTVNADGKPKNRVILLKSFSDKGFDFFTNYNSHKGHEIEANPQVAITFFWPNIERQIRIEGNIQKTTADISDAYFKTRPRDSQLSAWASDQSDIVDNREQLEEKLNAVKMRFSDEIPRPDHWGGYRVIPNYFEYWQGRENRYHDRIAYQKSENKWDVFRLSP